MTKRLYISNLPFTIEEDALELALADVLSAFGTVVSQKLIFEGTTVRPKGLCFVEMSLPEEAEHAITALHGLKVAGYKLKTGEARPRLCIRKPRIRKHSPITPPRPKRPRSPYEGGTRSPKGHGA